ncbi:MAG: septation protein SepH, partial [Actinomycetes bacterium]
MRTARLVGLSVDGRSVIVATDRGEELAVPVDDKLRAVLRGDRPRLGQLEIEMDSALTPRDIQSRIRSGQSLEEVARIAGMPMDRVERFAAPVLAERAHVARLAMGSSVRRRGETSAHRSLQATLTERLATRGVDIDSVNWDAHRLEDGRWAVTAGYRSGEAARQAEFVFDVAGRFSVAGNDDARWVLGEQSPARGPQPGRRRPEGVGAEDTEPTLDLSDELALVRAIQENPQPVENAPLASVQELRPSTSGEAAQPETNQPETDQPETDEAGPAGVTSEEPSAGTPRSSAAEPQQYPPAASQLDTLYGMLGGEGHPENAAREYRGLSDAAAVPDTVSGGWEPAIVVSYPVEPGPAGADEEGEAE